MPCFSNETVKGNRFEYDLPLANSLLLLSVVMRLYVDVLWVELTMLETIKKIKNIKNIKLKIKTNKQKLFII